MSKRLRCLFMGTPEFAVPTLEMLLHDPRVDIRGVISMPDRPAGRGKELHSPEVIEFARKNKLPIFQSANINKEPELLERFKGSVDFILVLAFAQFLNNKWLNLAPLGVYNIHTSLLPKYRGAAPIQAAILNGDRETGVSIQRMVKKMDAGDIVHSVPLTIFKEETATCLATRLKSAAALATYDFIGLLQRDQLSPVPQDEAQVSFAPTIKKEDGLLRFRSSTAEELLRQCRAYTSWPGTYCFLNGKRLKIFELESVDHKLSPGEVFLSSTELIVGTKSGAVKIHELQLEGKNRVLTQDFISGLQPQQKNHLILTEAP